MPGKLIRVVRDTEGRLLLKWVLADVSRICDECGAVISPGEQMVPYQDDFVDSRHCFKTIFHGHVARTYCNGCGTLLEDSLVTTEER